MNFIKRLFKNISQMFEQDERYSYGHPTLEEMQQFEIERRKKDKVDELITKNGFYNCCHGRSGYIYYVEDGHLCEMYYEASGNEKFDIALWLDFRKWVRPEAITIPRDKRLEILHKLRSWLQEQKLRAGIDLPANIEFEDKACIWSGCSEQKIKGSVYCLRHYDLNLLGE